jgi:adapter protein MecA 1/2
VDSIILIITKVDDPEELDTRFSRFSPESPDTAGGLSFADPKERIEGADDILGMIRKIMDSKLRAMQGENKETVPADAKSVEEDEEVRSLTRFYLFQSLDDAIRAAAVVDPVYDGPNSLYKNQEDGTYYLLLKKAESPAAQFNRVCNMLSEYAMTGKYIPGLDAHFGEHLEVIVEGNALHSLAQLR